MSNENSNRKKALDSLGQIAPGEIITELDVDASAIDAAMYYGLVHRVAEGIYRLTPGAATYDAMV